MNILLINADQLRHDCVGYRGLRGVKTPNLDALARESIVFEDAYTPLPVCSPARQSLLCGRRPDSIGAQWNYDFMPTPELDPSICWPGELKQSGWNTGYIGRFHVSATRHFHQVDHTLESLLCTDGDLDRTRSSAQHILHLTNNLEEVRT